MASMISYFGYVSCDDKKKNDPSSTFCWDGALSLGDNLNAVKCPVTQLKFLLEQSLAAAYYLEFYGPRCHEVINDYIEELNGDITYRFSKLSRQFQDNFLKMYNTLVNLMKFTRGGNWSDVDIKLVKEFLFDGNERIGLPIVWKRPDTLIPFLMWMNKGVQPGFDTFAAEKCGVCTLSLLPDPYERDASMMTIECNKHPIGRSFSAERTSLDRLTSCPLLGYLSHFDWSTCSFESCAAIISEFCLHEDIERYGVSLSHHLAYCLRQGVMFPMFDISGRHEGIEPVISRYHEQLFNAVLAFVTFCTEKRGMALTDRNLVAKAFGCIAYTKEQRESVAYLYKADATPSADELKAFKKVMGCVESLQLISQNPTLTTAQASTKVEGSTEEAAPDKGEAKTSPEPQKGSGESNKAEDGKSEPNQKEEGANDDAPPSNNDDGADDTRSDDTLEEDPNPEAGQDDAGSTPGGSGDPSTQEPSTQTGSAPEEPKTSDDQGIAFNFAVPDSSTVDSVLFREEMYKFLTNVLTNPPKCLSPQDIDTLTALKRFWLSCLSIETIKGIVEACIRLPKSIKHSIHKSTELDK